MCHPELTVYIQTANPLTSQSICGVRAEPQMSSDSLECQECATPASESVRETSSVATTLSDCRIEKHESYEWTDDSSDEMFSTPPTSLPLPNGVSYYIL